MSHFRNIGEAPKNSQKGLAEGKWREPSINYLDFP